jgi:hypothetical protein
MPSKSVKNKPRGKWSLKYKKKINCKRPKGFSQRQYCKYGRKTRKSKGGECPHKDIAKLKDESEAAHEKWRDNCEFRKINDMSKEENKECAELADEYITKLRCATELGKNNK